VRTDILGNYKIILQKYTCHANVIKVTQKLLFTSAPFYLQNAPKYDLFGHDSRGTAGPVYSVLQTPRMVALPNIGGALWIYRAKWEGIRAQRKRDENERHGKWFQ